MIKSWCGLINERSQHILGIDHYIRRPLDDWKVRQVFALHEDKVIVCNNVPESGYPAPHFSTFNAQSIEDFSTGFVDGRKVLTRVHLSSDKQWEDADVTYELILEAGVQRFHRFTRDQHKNRVDDGGNHIPMSNGQPLTYIPFVMVSHEGLRPEHGPTHKHRHDPTTR